MIYPTEPRRIGAGVEGISFRRAWFLLSDLITAAGEYNWKVLDDALKCDLPVSLRIMCNDPNRRMSFHGQSMPQVGLPAPMACLLKPYNHEGRGICFEVDYNDPLFRLVVGNFIAALGLRYDGHPNILVAEVGVLGQWGEWTTWRKGTSLLFGKKIQRHVIDLMLFYFKTTPVTGRHYRAPVRDKTAVSVGWEFASRDKPLGLHVDNILSGPVEVDLAQLDEFPDVWRRTLVGGEVAVPKWATCLNTDYDRLVELVKRYHISYLHGQFKPKNDIEAERLADLDFILRNQTGYRSEI
jgi:hypothetical protein